MARLPGEVELFAYELLTATKLLEEESLRIELRGLGDPLAHLCSRSLGLCRRQIGRAHV